MSFKALLEEIETLAKSFPNEGNDGGDGKKKGDGDPDDDKRIQAAADAGGGNGGGNDGGTDDDDDDDNDPLGKSFEVTLANGEKVKAQDGTELVKALLAENQDLKKAMGVVLRATKGVGTLVKSQSTEIDGLKTQLAALGDKGAGRKAVISLHEKPTHIAKSLEGQEDGITPQEFLTKSLDAQKAGRITGAEVARIDSFLGRGLEVPPDLVKRVIG